MTPRIFNPIKQDIAFSRNCGIMPANDTLFEVNNKGIIYIVDLAMKSCNCGARNVSGIPCKHALPFIIQTGGDIYDFVDASYTKETYLRAYVGIIHSLPDKTMWPHVDADDILPLLVKRAERV